MSLADARAAATEARKKISEDSDPVIARRRDEAPDHSGTFEAVALEWYRRKAKKWGPEYAKAILSKLEGEVFPVVGHLPIGDVRPAALLKIMHKVEDYAPSTAAKTTVLQLIYRMGYTTRVSSHGWRHTFSTVLNERGYHRDWIELQIAHVDGNSVRGTYNVAQYIDGRREMMQWYADYQDELRASVL